VAHGSEPDRAKTFHDTRLLEDHDPGSRDDAVTVTRSGDACRAVQLCRYASRCIILW
jgi:hypothetical protein